MSTETKDDTDMVVEVADDPEDEYMSSFDALEASSDLESKIGDYQTLLQNPRYDDKAVKVKEQCIYRYTMHCHYSFADATFHHALAFSFTAQIGPSVYGRKEV